MIVDERLVGRSPGKRIRLLADLKHLLGAPETIICLGNGPSSEDPRLAAYGGACLFRVNWIWLERGWMVMPDVVFTGDPDIVRLRRQPVVIFPTQAVGEPILRGYAAEGHSPQNGYAFLDRFDPAVVDLTGPRIPTNGALMVAAAALLRPRRLVIAGIDLYRHESGKYPGSDNNFEGYTSQHSEALDIRVIQRALAAFSGDVRILSGNLHTALQSKS